jgi:hypothetical protein
LDTSSGNRFHYSFNRYLHSLHIHRSKFIGFSRISLDVWPPINAFVLYHPVSMYWRHVFRWFSIIFYRSHQGQLLKLLEIQHPEARKTLQFESQWIYAGNDINLIEKFGDSANRYMIFISLFAINSTEADEWLSICY